MTKYPSYPMHTCKCQALACGQIVHCPLHAKAPEMLEFIRAISVGGKFSEARLNMAVRDARTILRNLEG